MKNLLKSFFKKEKIENVVSKSNFSYFNFKNFSTKVVKNSAEAVKDIKSGMSVMTGGFGICGIPNNLINALAQRSDVKDLQLISNNGGLADYGNGLLIKNKQVKRIIGSYVGENKDLESQYFRGEIELELVPQGTLAEKIRCGGAGIPAFYTPTGYGTIVQEGGFAIKLDSQGRPEIISQPKPTAMFGSLNYVLEDSLRADFALIKAAKADTEGNLVFNKTARNFNHDMASSGKITIAEVDEIVEAGQIDPDKVHVPGIYVQKVVLAENKEKKLEKFRKQEDVGKIDQGKGKIAKRAAEEIRNGMYINLGIGIPNLVVDYLSPDVDVTVQTENGMLGVGPYPFGKEDPDLINAIKEAVSETKGCSYFKSSDSFGMIRGKHIDATILGGFQVSQAGDLANWIVPGKIVKGMGGAMDLVGSRGGKVIVVMEHVTKDNKHRVLERCSYPITGRECVDTLITDLGVFQFIRNSGFILTDLFKGVSLDTVKQSTGFKFHVAEKLRILDY